MTKLGHIAVTNEIEQKKSNERTNGQTNERTNEDGHVSTLILYKIYNYYTEEASDTVSMNRRCISIVNSKPKPNLNLNSDHNG